MIFNKFSVLPHRVALTTVVFILLSAVFGVYVYAEKQVDRENERRLASFRLADALRQSSDELTRMVRTYAVTGDPRYKKYYQDILDIRNGKMPRPEGYADVYWDLVLSNRKAPPAENGRGVALLELMRQAGFAEEELAKLAQAKKNSDVLTAVEFDAMRLLESVGPEAEDNRARARLMLHDENYHQAKAAIMQPINEFFVMMDKRTLASVNTWVGIAYTLRLIFIAATLAATFMLWRAYTALRITLGGSADEVYESLLRIGRGDLTTAIRVAPGMENSILAGVSEMQKKLYANDVERKQLEERIHQLAFYDTLTKLPNRSLLNDRLAQVMAASKRSRCYGALIFLDLDNFKPLNDTHGHAVGDSLLIEVANRLKGCVRDMDTVARYGGDEFVVMINELNEDKAESISQAEVVAEKVRGALSKPYLLTIKHEGMPDTTIEHYCPASIGVTVFVDNEPSQEDILRWADAAMYQAKGLGRNQIRFYGLDA